MLTKKETHIVIDVLEKWPGGMGCILIKDETKKNGWKKADWGFQWKMFGNFKYDDIQKIEGELLFCPVTAVGLQRNVKNHRDHHFAYNDIIAALKSTTVESEKYVRTYYNAALKKNPKERAYGFLVYMRDHFTGWIDHKE